MFKYISEILAQFTKSQKITALCILLFVILLITISPSLISAITLDRKDLDNKIENQASTIKRLEIEVDSLDLNMRKNQASCTKEITQKEKEYTDETVKREREFIAMLDELKRDIEKRNNINHSVVYTKMELESHTKSNSYTDSLMGDTPEIVLATSSMKNDVSPINLNSVISKINGMKKKLNK